MAIINGINTESKPRYDRASEDQPSQSATTLHEVLAQRATAFGQRRAYTYQGNQGDEVITYRELNDRARAIAARISQVAKPGDRALLVFPAGLDFVTSFFGCLYAGVMAVPATYPKPRRPMPRLSAIASDCDATIALTTAQTLTTMDQARNASDLPEMEWIAVDEIPEELAEACPSIEISSTDLAFLQYTSGSTSEPRGVMVSHGNLLHNLEMIRQGFGIDKITCDDDIATGVFWLPAYHDMGLIGGILEAMYVGGHSVLMSPAAFLQRPLGWLETISAHRAAISGAPNFAYELCVTRSTDEQRQKLDLGNWQVAFCGAEPIRAETLEAFSQAFSPAGFSMEAFYPCYGLAECTLLAAGGDGPGNLVIRNVSRDALEQHRAEFATECDGNMVQRLVGSGHSLFDQEILIVDPETQQPCPPDRVGEIWIKGGSVTQGYWQRPDETESAFHAQVGGGQDGKYVRTGDLGFIASGCLFVTGRVKDVMIIRGRNHYPQDIERTVGGAHEALLRDSGAVFSLTHNGDEQLAIVQEVDRHYRKADFNEIIRHVRRAVAEAHELEVHTVVLIRHASLSRTTSGKAQRHLCREQLECGELKVLATWTREVSTESSRANGKPHDASDTARSSNGELTSTPSDPRLGPSEESLTADEIDRLAERVESWLLTWMVDRAAIPREEVDRNKPFAEYGLDSMTAVELSQELEDWLGVEVVPTVAWNYPTPATLSKYLARQAAGVGDEHADDGVADAPPTDDEFARLLAEVENMSDEEARELLNGDAGAQSSNR